MTTINLQQLHITRNDDGKVHAIGNAKISANYLTITPTTQTQLKEMTQVTKH